jgi:formylglycine-generating enzyme required for sulfatase activity
MDLGNGVSMEMAWIPPGKFEMGSPDDEWGRGNNGEDLHTVQIAEAFWLGKYEVTQAQWQGVMGCNPSFFTNVGPTAPVEQVSWHDCQQFIAKVNSYGTNRGFRLPTEAEWEYACRAGTRTAFNSGKNVTRQPEPPLCPGLDEIGWYGGNSVVDGMVGPHPVGQKKPNAWGLYDMHGNVGEWCEKWDQGGGIYLGPRPIRPVRGGMFFSDETECRAADRAGGAPDESDNLTGFRLAKDP